MCRKSFLLDFHLNQDTCRGRFSLETHRHIPTGFAGVYLYQQGTVTFPGTPDPSAPQGKQVQTCTALQDSGTSIQPSLCGRMPAVTRGNKSCRNSLSPRLCQVDLKQRTTYRYFEKGFHFSVLILLKAQMFT